ncbi:MAG TPA: UDP-glucose 4-epimerase GalE [Candidatus Limnocylindrales bacterium]|nr:UDP-glucose 4-epimerase GalE [Candidatus Limnocylindrales bacterium]
MKILVTGGAGYIGSFMVNRLLKEDHDVVIADSLERGSKLFINERATFFEGDLLNKEFVSNLFTNNNFEAVMHFGAYISVEESMQNPGLYFTNNVQSTVNLLDAMKKHKIKHFIFSSTGTVYGTPQKLPVTENHPKNPENPYAESKLMVERILHWYFQVAQIGYAVLRYFNAAGGALDGSSGENHNPETHLIPNAIKSAIDNQPFNLFGDDYPTSDGTCVRDYIHVLDLIEAHILTLKKLQEQNGEYIYNVGTGKGSTNKEVVEMVKKVSGQDFPINIKPRRDGDVAEIVADTKLIESELGFETKYSDLEMIIRTAWDWHSKNTSNEK